MNTPTYSAPIPCGNGATLGLVTSRKKGVMRMSDAELIVLMVLAALGLASGIVAALNRWRG